MGFHGNFDTKVKMAVIVLPGAVQLARPFPVTLSWFCLGLARPRLQIHCRELRCRY